MNLLKRDEFYGKYFHFIVVFSPTAKIDDLYKSLELPEENHIEDITAENLNKIIEARKKLIEQKGIEFVGKNSRMLIIIDDCIGSNAFLQSPEAVKLFALLRHYLVSVIILIQSYTKISRACRINANSIMIFPSNINEVEVLLDEITPPSLSKKQFKEVISFATNDKYDFLYINNKADPKARFRKNLDDLIDLKDFGTK